MTDDRPSGARAGADDVAAPETDALAGVAETIWFDGLSEDNLAFAAGKDSYDFPS